MALLQTWRRLLPPGMAPVLELRTLLAIVFTALAVWAFAALYDEVREGETLDFDHAALMLFREPGNPDEPIGPGWLETSVRDVTALGGTVITSFITLAVAAYLVMTGKRGAAGFVLVSVLGAMLLGYGLKDLFERPRPDLVPHGVMVYTSSFPSGHATGSAATYLTLAALLARFHKSRPLKAYLLGLAVFITVVVGLSRLYLGVHWATDVLAGWTLGAGWALACWTVARILQHRGRLEPESDPAR